MIVSVYREESFNAAHRLHVPNWSDERNKEVFGLCNNPHYHGHNYRLIAKVTGQVDPVTGYVIDLKILKDILHREVIERYDHRNLNLDIDDFKNLNPTAENIAVTIWKRVRNHLPDQLKVTIILYETERNFVEYTGE